MQLEEEALNYSKGKDESIKEKVTEMCETMENLIVSNLHPCHERKMVEQLSLIHI